MLKPCDESVIYITFITSVAVIFRSVWFSSLVHISHAPDAFIVDYKARVFKVSGNFREVWMVCVVCNKCIARGVHNLPQILLQFYIFDIFETISVLFNLDYRGVRDFLLILGNSRDCFLRIAAAVGLMKIILFLGNQSVLFQLINPEVWKSFVVLDVDVGHAVHVPTMSVLPNSSKLLPSFMSCTLSVLSLMSATSTSRVLNFKICRTFLTKFQCLSHVNLVCVLSIANGRTPMKRSFFVSL